MIRLFLSPEELSSQPLVITGDQARYLSSVVRLKQGELFSVLDGQGRRYVCKSLKIGKREVVAEKVEENIFSAESPLSLTLAQGIPKAEKMDLIVEKSTELGVSTIVPLITERAQVRHTEKTGRWRKIALSAARQSGRERIPEIKEPEDIKEFLSTWQGIGKQGETEQSHLALILSEEEKKQALRDVLQKLHGAPAITILVGPEGGFSGSEIAAAIQTGFLAVSLGPRILRTETAPITALSILQYELGDL